LLGRLQFVDPAKIRLIRGVTNVRSNCLMLFYSARASGRFYGQSTIFVVFRQFERDVPSGRHSLCPSAVAR
jgi:hypothetical protein